MAQILEFPSTKMTVKLVSSHDLLDPFDVPKKPNCHIKKEFVPDFHKEMYVFYKNNRQLGAATSILFLRYCYASFGAKDAPVVE